MTAADLKIGNYISIKGNRDITEIVTSISFMEIGVVGDIVDDDLEEKFYPINKICPAKIEPFLMGIMGFIKNPPLEDGTINFWNKKMDVSVDFTKEKRWYYRINGTIPFEVYSIHEIQNLYFSLRRKEIR